MVGIANVSPHGGLLSEGRAAHRALKRPFAGVCVHVIFKVVLLAEHAATHRAGEAQGGLVWWQGKESGAQVLQEKQRPCS